MNTFLLTTLIILFTGLEAHCSSQETEDDQENGNVVKAPSEEVSRDLDLVEQKKTAHDILKLIEHESPIVGDQNLELPNLTLSKLDFDKVGIAYDKSLNRYFYKKNHKNDSQNTKTINNQVKIEEGKDTLEETYPKSEFSKDDEEETSTSSLSDFSADYTSYPGNGNTNYGEIVIIEDPSQKFKRANSIFIEQNPVPKKGEK